MIGIKEIQRGGWPWVPGCPFRDTVDFDRMIPSIPKAKVSSEECAKILFDTFDVYVMGEGKTAMLVIKTVEGTYVDADGVLSYAYGRVYLYSRCGRASSSEFMPGWKHVKRVMLKMGKRIPEQKLIRDRDRPNEKVEMRRDEIPAHDAEKFAEREPELRLVPEVRWA